MCLMNMTDGYVYRHIHVHTHHVHICTLNHEQEYNSGSSRAIIVCLVQTPHKPNSHLWAEHSMSSSILPSTCVQATAEYVGPAHAARACVQMRHAAVHAGGPYQDHLSSSQGSRARHASGLTSQPEGASERQMIRVIHQCSLHLQVPNNSISSNGASGGVVGVGSGGEGGRG